MSKLEMNVSDYPDNRSDDKRLEESRDYSYEVGKKQGRAVALGPLSYEEAVTMGEAMFDRAKAMMGGMPMTPQGEWLRREDAAWADLARTAFETLRAQRVEKGD